MDDLNCPIKTQVHDQEANEKREAKGGKSWERKENQIVLLVPSP